jgi:putative transposase
MIVPTATKRMSIGRPKTALVLSEDERIQVSSLAQSRTLPHAIIARAKVALWSAEGTSNTEIAGRLQWTKASVGKWRRPFIERRLPGLCDELRPGRPRSIEDEQVAALLKRTLSRKPKAGTHWTVRSTAQVNGIRVVPDPTIALRDVGPVNVLAELEENSRRSLVRALG